MPKCKHADVRFLPEELEVKSIAMNVEPLGDTDIDRVLASLGRLPLGVDPEREFRISIVEA